MPQVLVRLTNGECAKRNLPAPLNRPLSISGPVGMGGKNVPADVKTIQSALNRVPVEHGGPNPLLGVDGIVGPKTTGAIAAFQRRQLGWSDSRVDPDNKTIASLRLFQSTNGSAADDLKRNPYTLMLVYATLPIAQILIRNAIRFVDSSLDLLNGRAILFKEQAEDRFATLNVFFNLEKLPKQVQVSSLIRIKTVFKNMETAIGHKGPATTEGTGIFQSDPQDQQDTYAFTYLGGFTRRDAKGSPKMSKDDNYTGPNLREDAIYICTGLDGRNSEFTAYNTVHELAHWVGPEIRHPNTIEDFSYRHKSDFYKLRPDVALRTADSYAMFSVAASDRGLVEDASIFMPPMIIRGKAKP